MVDTKLGLIEKAGANRRLLAVLAYLRLGAALIAAAAPRVSDPINAVGPAPTEVLTRS